MPKNIVICLDGTNNEIAGKSTNVMRLRRCLIADADQIVYYDTGVGTTSDPMSIGWYRSFVERHLDGAIGRSIGVHFASAYQFVVANYSPGDMIYIFGFSRGAYTARALSGALHWFGLLRPHAANLAPYLWSIYANTDKRLAFSDRSVAAARFKRHFGQNVTVKFMGLWDTVSSFGWVFDFQTLPYTDKHPSCECIRHAMALDERRGLFAPMNLTLTDPAPGSQPCDVQDVWFPGAHADVGGGYPDSEAGLSREPLLWIAREATKHDLRLDWTKLNDIAAGLGPPMTNGWDDRAHDESTRLLWAFTEFLFQRKWDYWSHAMRWFLPHLWRGRDPSPSRPSKGGLSPPLIFHESARLRSQLPGQGRSFPSGCTFIP